PAVLDTFVNQAVTFSNLVATGNGVRYQWRRNGIVVPGATNANFSIAIASIPDSGTYTALAYTDGGGQISSNVVLDVTDPNQGSYTNSIVAGFNLIANQLNGTNNLLGTVISGAHEGDSIA